MPEALTVLEHARRLAAQVGFLKRLLTESWQQHTFEQIAENYFLPGDVSRLNLRWRAMAAAARLELVASTDGAACCSFTLTVQKAMSDMLTCATRRVARAMAGAGSAVRVYHFTHVPTFLPWYLAHLGSVHGAELRYLFGTLPDTAAEVDLAVSSALIDTWGHVVNNRSRETLEWVDYTDGGTVMRFSEQCGVARESDSHCDLWLLTMGPSGLMRPLLFLPEPWWSTVVNQHLLSVIVGGARAVLAVADAMLRLSTLLLGAVWLIVRWTRPNVPLASVFAE